MTTYFQQGDVLLFKIEQDHVANKITRTKLCHKGDNHSHDFEFPVIHFDDIFVLEKDTRLLHFEHKEILLPKGVYKKWIVKEYDHFTEEARAVID